MARADQGYLLEVSNTQAGLVREYLNYRRSQGDLVSAQSYRSAFNTLYKSSSNGVRPVPMETPFVTKKVFSSSLLYDWLKRAILNFNVLTIAQALGFSSLLDLGSSYDGLIAQSKDNLEKLMAVRSTLVPVAVNVAHMAPLVYQAETNTAQISATFLPAQKRGENVEITSETTSQLFPLVISCKSPTKLKNAEAGASFSITPESPLYLIDFKYLNFDVDESFTYALELAKQDNTIAYRASADAVHYSDWSLIDNFDEFHHLINDYGEPVGIDFRLRSRRRNLNLSPEWFVNKAAHVVSVRLSLDYGLVVPVSFALITPVIADVVSFYNYGTAPFIVDRVEGSLDNVTYYPLQATRTTVNEYVRITLNNKFPIKYIKFYIKQETYTCIYETVPTVEGVLNKLALNFDNPKHEQVLLAKRYDVGWKLVHHPTLKKELRDLQLSVNWDDTETQKLYKYEIKIGNITVNNANIVAQLV